MPTDTEQVIDLLPCRECEAPCQVETFDGTHFERPAVIWICSKHKMLGGKCPSDTAYLTAEAWNERLTLARQYRGGDDDLPEQLRAWQGDLPEALHNDLHKAADEIERLRGIVR